MTARGRAARLLLAALLAAGCGCTASAKEARMDEAVKVGRERVLAGRFSFEAPAGAALADARWSVRDISLAEVALAEPRDEAFGKAWAAQLAAVEALKAKRSRPRHLYGEVHSTHELGPRFACVVYNTGNVRMAVQYTALRQVDGAALRLDFPGDTEDLSLTLARLAKVGKAWQPRAPGARPAKGDVFHLAHGDVLLPFEEEEAATVILEGEGVRVRLATATTAEPAATGLMERFGKALLEAGAAFAPNASVVRSRGRKAAGLEGEELVLRDVDKRRLEFLWEFKGEPRSGAKPEIQLQLTTPDADTQAKLALWDALLDSLRPAAAP